MNNVPTKEIFKDVAIEMAINPAFVEKDWHAVWILSLFSSFRSDYADLIFSGGTALSKAHHLIYRFSEDLDFRLLLKKGYSSRRILSSIKNSLIEYLEKNGAHIEDIRAQNENRYITFNIKYPISFKDEKLRPFIKIELAVRDLALEPLGKKISSFVNELSMKAPEVPGQLHEIEIRVFVFWS